MQARTKSFMHSSLVNFVWAKRRLRYLVLSHLRQKLDLLGNNSSTKRSPPPVMRLFPLLPLCFLLLSSAQAFKRAFSVSEYRALLKEHYFDKEWDRASHDADALTQEQRLKRLRLHREMCQVS